jgi:hypothetical protein
MSNIKIGAPGWDPTATQIAVLGDVLDLSPADARFSYAYAVVSAPGGSSAGFSGATFTPDVVGAYVLSVTAGADVLRLPLFVFGSSVYSGLASYPTRVGTRPDVERRQIMQGVARSVATATLMAWNAGTVPSVNFAQFGG